MIAPADVLKLKCRFIQEAYAYFYGAQYFLDGQICIVKDAYLDALNAIQSNCLSDDALCVLKDKLKKSPAACDVTDVLTCDEQLPVSLSLIDSSSCNFAAGLYNSTGPSTLMEFSLADNSQVITGTITSKLTNSCGLPIESDVFTNQQSYSDRPKGSTRLGPSGTFGNALEATSYIKTLRVYETDEFGVFQDVPIDLDLDPETSDYYGPSAPFPDLVSVTPSDLQMGSSVAVFKEAFQTLMDNVSLVRYGVIGKHDIAAWPTNNGKYLNIGSAPKHNPSGNWFGINRQNAYIKVATASGDRTATLVGFLLPASIINGTASYNLSCGTINLTIGNSSVTSPLDYAQTTFNKIVLASNFAALPLTYTSNSLTCNVKTLVATYDATNVTSVAWTNSDDEVLSTTDTVTTGLAGVYTFTVNLSNGCTIIKTITI